MIVIRCMFVSKAMIPAGHLKSHVFTDPVACDRVREPRIGNLHEAPIRMRFLPAAVQLHLLLPIIPCSPSSPALTREEGEEEIQHGGFRRTGPEKKADSVSVQFDTSLDVKG